MRRRLPPWGMGLAMAPLGFYFGFVTTALPILLSAHGVPVGRIGEVSATAFSPTFWAFSLGPIVDVRFTRRTYSIVFVTIAAVCLGISTLLTRNLAAFTGMIVVGCTAIVLFGNALNGWLADVIENEHYPAVGATSNVANLGAAGAFGALAIVLIRTLHPVPAAILLMLTMLAPMAMLFFIPMPAHPTRGIAETFGNLWRDVKYVCKRPGFLLGLACFLSPASCFALTNVFSGMGADFHASEAWVTTINGPAVAIVCSLGCLAAIPICRRLPLRTIYIVAGFGGALAAIFLILMPHTVSFFAAGVLAYNFFQGINYTAFSALGFEIVGPDNPFAATQLGLLAAAANFAITYMTEVDGHFYTKRGLPGIFGADAIVAASAGVILLFVFHHFAGEKAGDKMPIEQVGA